jgi:hypothetical protein
MIIYQCSCGFAIDRHADVTVVAHGVQDGLRVGTALRVQGAQHPVDVRGRARVGFVWIQPHRGASSARGQAAVMRRLRRPHPYHVADAGPENGRFLVPLG